MTIAGTDIAISASGSQGEALYVRVRGPKTPYGLIVVEVADRTGAGVTICLGQGPAKQLIRKLVDAL